MKLLTTALVLTYLASNIQGISLPSALRQPLQIYNQAVQQSRSARSVSGSGSARSALTFTKCYNHYLPILSEIAETTEKQTALCEVNAGNAEAEARLKASAKKENLDDFAVKITNALQTCNNISDALDGLSCHTRSNYGVVDLETISHQSTGAINAYNLEISNVNATLTSCIYSVSQEGKVQSNREWNNLQWCLESGVIPLPPPTLPPPVDTTTPEAIVQVTESP